MQGILGKERKFSSGVAKLLGFYILQQPFFFLFFYSKSEPGETRDEEKQNEFRGYSLIHVIVFNNQN